MPLFGKNVCKTKELGLVGEGRRKVLYVDDQYVVCRSTSNSDGVSDGGNYLSLAGPRDPTSSNVTHYFRLRIHFRRKVSASAVDAPMGNSGSVLAFEGYLFFGTDLVITDEKSIHSLWLEELPDDSTTVITNKHQEYSTLGGEGTEIDDVNNELIFLNLYGGSIKEIDTKISWANWICGNKKKLSYWEKAFWVVLVLWSVGMVRPYWFDGSPKSSVPSTGPGWSKFNGKIYRPTNSWS